MGYKNEGTEQELLVTVNPLGKHETGKRKAMSLWSSFRSLSWKGRFCNWNLVLRTGKVIIQKKLQTHVFFRFILLDSLACWVYKTPTTRPFMKSALVWKEVWIIYEIQLCVWQVQSAPHPAANRQITSSGQGKSTGQTPLTWKDRNKVKVKHSEKFTPGLHSYKGCKKMCI